MQYQRADHFITMKLIFAFFVLFLTACSAQNCRNTRVTGAASSFAAPIYTRWFADLRRMMGPNVPYVPVGSSEGTSSFVRNVVDFAGSDTTLSRMEKRRIRRGFVQIPMTGSGIVVAYNNPACRVLRLTGATLCDIFTGRIKTWAQLGCPCSGNSIKLVSRADGSGTTLGFTRSLKAFRGARFPGSPSNNYNFRTAVKRPGNSGVAKYIRQTRCAIGYVGFGEPGRMNFRLAILQNKARRFVAPTQVSIAAGLANIKLNALNEGFSPNPSGPNSYPIVTLTWVFAYRRGYGAAKSACVKKMLNYMLSTAAQRQVPRLGYVPLPFSIRQRGQRAVNLITRS